MPVACAKQNHIFGLATLPHRYPSASITPASNSLQRDRGFVTEWASSSAWHRGVRCENFRWDRGLVTGGTGS